ncbi:MAG: peptidase domain-containing ABC transporter [Microcystis panniformis Mp_MB_F_20051200_S9]|uniref:Peptidase domain-containing ABC transporter n=1 Tax=Microcystis panniformis Mp_MB_F_20051200_S9 TaxID=2486223 RepID=A0A552PTN9_9CHRO|nr:MAG: peptidase domain-containing ABC transporter [Microcystis panniformis Mp_MB_F_20080800_S26D]TRV43594.1 MAG: peptidase domain-containing ABC transporter [Microcystis panniformis Mp_GB_SS_20050300_S99]TRV49803.1 MAG: peptidase domain-containing ABC transporter [Microcystis panniformis Mp_GB_SS_20050300_S99D]TRV56533.1 MAG: peptidase domain-containing ABC transporter [Microcystis panniformis Mp_MB_F_20080800_S26]TRV60363.1 MAG: peptidase domain-containing ABC transporter [Microcystis pannif
MLKLFRFPCVLQLGESDCGAACLASIAKHSGYTIPISYIRDCVGTGQQGTTLLGLKRGAEVLGFHAQAVKGSAEILDKFNSIPLPAVIHWMGYHWVVLYGRKRRKYVIADPAVGVRYLSRRELIEGWQNYIMLILEADPVRLALTQDNYKVNNLEQIFQRIRPYWAILAEALLLNFFLGLTNMAYPLLIQILSDDVLVRRDFTLLNGIVIAVTVMSLFNGGLWLAQSTLTAHFAQRLELSLILEFVRKILCLPLTYYETHRSGEIISRLRDIQRIRNIISQILVSFPSELFIAIASLIFLFFYSWKLMLITALSAATMMLSTIVFLPTLLQQTRHILAEEGENQAILIETFKGGLTLKTTSSASQLWEQLQFRSSRLANLTFRTIQINITNRTFSRIISNLGSVGLLWFGSKLVIVQEISIGQLVASYSLSQNVILLVVDSVTLINELIWIKNAAARLIEVTTTNSEISLDNLTKPFIKISGNADIFCSHLNFHYPGQVPLLEDFSISIPGGQVVALIGESGCGKSTLVKLIAGLYPLQSGNIRLGIYNLNDLALDCLRQQVILIPQEPHFWSRSIIDNFRLGRPHVTLEEIVRACQLAKIDDFISGLPDQYHTVLGEFGANISGGQRQRLAIARAIVTDPPILILDESTANLDPLSETYVLDGLLNHRQGKTTILISHRPRVINRANLIILLEQGRLKMQGTLAELKNQSGTHLDFLTP